MVAGGKDFYRVLSVAEKASQEEIKLIASWLRFTIQMRTRAITKLRSSSRTSVRPTQYWVTPENESSMTRYVGLVDWASGAAKQEVLAQGCQEWIRAFPSAT